MNVVVDGLMTGYQKTGRGKTLLMIHGWGDSARTFSALVDELKDSYQIVALDLPGFGATQAPEELWGTKDFAAFVAAFIKKLDLKTYAVLGHSFGGAIAMELAAQKPAFKKLVLLASAGVRNKKSVKTTALKAAAKAAKPALLVLPKEQRNKLKRRVYGSIGSDALLLPHMETVYRRIITEDLRPLASNIKLPSLLIYGSKDKETPAADGLALHKLIKDSDFQIIEAGHFPHQTETSQTARLIRDFLEMAQ